MFFHLWQDIHTEPTCECVYVDVQSIYCSMKYKKNMSDELFVALEFMKSNVYLSWAHL